MDLLSLAQLSMVGEQSLKDSVPGVIKIYAFPGENVFSIKLSVTGLHGPSFVSTFNVKTRKDFQRHIYTMEYYSAIKRNEIELFVVRWMNLESVIQSEVSQKDKNRYRMLTHINGI